MPYMTAHLTKPLQIPIHDSGQPYTLKNTEGMIFRCVTPPEARYNLLPGIAAAEARCLMVGVVRSTEHWEYSGWIKICGVWSAASPSEVSFNMLQGWVIRRRRIIRRIVFITYISVFFELLRIIRFWALNEFCSHKAPRAPQKHSQAL